MAGGAVATGRNDVWIALIIALGIIGVIVALFGMFGVVSKNADETQQALITACVENGGSWIVDSGQGECWQMALTPSIRTPG